MSPIIYVFVFVAALLLFEAARLMLPGRGAAQQAARRRLTRMATGLTAPEVGQGESALRKRRQTSSGIEGILRELPGYDRIRLQLYRAGLSFGPARLLWVCATVGLLGWIVGNVIFPASGRALLFGVVGFAPWIFVARRASKRLLKFESQLPEALDLLTRALRAGQSLSSGFRLIASELPDPIGFEFAQVADQVKLGQDMPVALTNLSYRIESPSLPFLVTAIVIQRETGSNLAEVLEKLAAIIRERFRFFGKVSALTAMGRMSANILAVWPVVMVSAIYMVNPGYVEPLWATDVGNMMIMVCIPLVVIGYWLCRRMAMVEV